MYKKISALTFILIISPTSAFADWGEVGVALRCDLKQKIFEIAPTVLHSSPEYSYPAPVGFKKLSNGKGQRQLCALVNNNKVELGINIYGPQARGMGQGLGVVIIDTLKVGGHSVIGKPTNFNWQVISEKVLSRIRIIDISNNTIVELCYSDGYSPEKPYQNEVCSERAIPKAVKH